MAGNIKKGISLAAGIITFLIWIKLVGNPHVIETVIGIVIAIIVSGMLYRKLGKR